MRKKELQMYSTIVTYLKTLSSIQKHGKISVISVDKPEIKVNETRFMLAVYK